MRPKLKESFKEKYRKILGDEADSFFEWCYKRLTKSIRVNTLKIGRRKLESRLIEKDFKLKEIPWCKEGFWVLNKWNLGNTLEFFLGYYYVQEAASMIPPLILEPKPGDFVLDLTASPGSKTTQMAAMMKNEGVIVANDLTRNRLNPLMSNLRRFGVINSIVTKCDGRKLRIDGKFDKVLLDAPCTATGAIRKNWEIIKMWNPHQAKRLSKLQKGLAENAYLHLKEGGTLVYSTCTLESEENEGVVDHLLKNHSDLELKKIRLRGLKMREGLKKWEKHEFDPSVKKCARIYPQDNDTEGFFIAKLVKG